MQEWKLVYDEWDPEEQPLREALCALGNGLFVTRGAAEEATAGGPHYPGTYLAGGYNRLETEIGGRVVENEDLVNFPNWLRLDFRPDGGAWLDLEDVEILDFRQELDLASGILERRVHFRDEEGRETELCSQRLVHMEHPHLAAQQWTLKPRNWSGGVEVVSALDGRVENDGVARYSELDGDHLEPLGTGRVGEDAIDLRVRTRQSHLVVAQAARTRVFRGDLRGEEPASVERETVEEEGWVAHRLRFRVEREHPVRVEKVVALYTSRDAAISEPGLAAGESVRRAPGFARLADEQRLAWQRAWSYCDLELGEDGGREEEPCADGAESAGEQAGDEPVPAREGGEAEGTLSRPRAQLILRLHVFHLLQTVSINSIGRDVGVPARGWHGEAYRGHVFWDELFIFPYLTLRIPELARALLMYRYRRLPEARHGAREAGFEGAMFPWQSGSDGREESQVVHLNPESGRWIPDETHLQRHVGAAIAYNVWRHFEATADMEFLTFYGTEILIEIARFFTSLAWLDADSGRWHICGVAGPDEFHTHYPEDHRLWAGEPGLDDNAYTNVMASWVLRKAGEALELVSGDRREALLSELDVPAEEVSLWDQVARKLRVPMRDDGLILQFDGWEELEELDWDHYREEYGDIHRLDRILEAEGDDVNRYKASKQADVLMLFYLFSGNELEELLGTMGYDLDADSISRHVDYYEERTAHGSTLSSMVHSWVLSRSDRARSWKWFEQALRSDIDDIQGGTTPEGIHLGAMAGTVDLVQRCYTGVEVRDDVLWLNPRLPRELGSLCLTLRYRAHWLHVDIVTSTNRLRVAFRKGWSPEVQVGFADRVHTFHHGQSRVFDLETGEVLEEAGPQEGEGGEGDEGR